MARRARAQTVSAQLQFPADEGLGKISSDCFATDASLVARSTAVWPADCLAQAAMLAARISRALALRCPCWAHGRFQVPLILASLSVNGRTRSAAQGARLFRSHAGPPLSAANTKHDQPGADDAGSLSTLRLSENAMQVLADLQKYVVVVQHACSSPWRVTRAASRRHTEVGLLLQNPSTASKDIGKLSKELGRLDPAVTMFEEYLAAIDDAEQLQELRNSCDMATDVRATLPCNLMPWTSHVAPGFCGRTEKKWLSWPRMSSGRCGRLPCSCATH